MESLGMNPTFWQGKRVFITGHTGFKGGWLSLWLQSLGAEVTGFALAPEDGPTLFDVAGVGDGMESILGDVCDPLALGRAMDGSRPHIVFHLAAQSLVRFSYDHPVETYATNVMGTVHALEASRKSDSVRVFINVTSDKCYENREWVWGYRENEPMGGYDPYSSSKGCAELVTGAYRSSFMAAGRRNPPVALASARAGNVIGGGDWAKDRIVPDMMRALLKGEPLKVRNPAAIRPWQHALEPLSGYLLLAEKCWEDDAAYAGGWNFGPAAADARPVQWIVERLAESWGENAGWLKDGGNHPHEAHFLTLDSAKAQTYLGWKPRWSLDRALASVVDWYKAFRAGASMRAVTLEQIGAYGAS